MSSWLASPCVCRCLLKRASSIPGGRCQRCDLARATLYRSRDTSYPVPPAQIRTCRLFPLVTALPSPRSAARRGALFAGIFGTLLVSADSGPCIAGAELRSSRCGPPGPGMVRPESSRFPRTERARMLGGSDRAEPEAHSRFRAPRCGLPLAHRRRPLWTHSFRGAMARLRGPLPTSRRSPRGDLRTARGRGGSLHLPRNGLAPYAPYRSPGKSGRCVTQRSLTDLPQGHRVSTWVCAASVWGSQNVMSMVWYIFMAVESSVHACSAHRRK